MQKQLQAQALTRVIALRQVAGNELQCMVKMILVVNPAILEIALIFGSIVTSVINISFCFLTFTSLASSNAAKIRNRKRCSRFDRLLAS